MTSLLLQPDATMVDGVSLTYLPDHSVIKKAGYQAEILYVANKYGTNRTAIERAWAAGVPVMLNYEGIEDDAKNGYPAGKRAALLAIVEAKKLGFNGDCPLPFSGSDRHFADIWGAGLQYHRALVDVFSSIGWVAGAYGFKEMLAALSQQTWWPDDWPLWHWGGDGTAHYDWAHVKQGPGGSYYNPVIKCSVDHNLLLKPMRFWTGDGPDQPPPSPPPPPKPSQPKDTEMPVFKRAPDGTVWERVIDGRGRVAKRRVGNPENPASGGNDVFGWCDIPNIDAIGVLDQGSFDGLPVAEYPVGSVGPHTHSVTGSTGPSQ